MCIRDRLQEQRRVLRALAAHGDCIIVGRNADLILAEHRPLKLFVYACLLYTSSSPTP